MSLDIIDCARRQLNNAGIFEAACQAVLLDYAPPYRLVGDTYDHMGIGIQCITGFIAADGSTRDQRIDLGAASVPHGYREAPFDEGMGDTRTHGS